MNKVENRLSLVKVRADGCHGNDQPLAFASLSL